MSLKRRYAGVGLERRHMRGERGGERGGAPATIAPYQALLGATLVEAWHCQLGIPANANSVGVDTWTGQILGTVLQAATSSNRPTYAADGSKFGGKPVVQSVVTGAKCLAALGIPTILANGSKPWLYVRGRWRGATAGTLESLVSIGVSGSRDYFHTRTDPSTGANLQSFSNFIGTTNGPAYDNAAHSVQVGLDGAGHQRLIIDSSTFDLAAAGNILDSITAVGVGRGCTVGTQVGNVSHALFFLLSSYPGSSVMNAVDAVGVAEFPP